MSARAAIATAAAIGYVAVLTVLALGFVSMPGPDVRLDVGDSALFLNVPTAIGALFAGVGVGALLGRWWSPLLLVFPALAGPVATGSLFPGPPVAEGAVFGQDGALIFVAIFVAVWVADAIPVVLGVGARKVAGRVLA